MYVCIYLYNGFMYLFIYMYVFIYLYNGFIYLFIIGNFYCRIIKCTTHPLLEYSGAESHTASLSHKWQFSCRRKQLTKSRCSECRRSSGTASAPPVATAVGPPARAPPMGGVASALTTKTWAERERKNLIPLPTPASFSSAASERSARVLEPKSPW